MGLRWIQGGFNAQSYKDTARSEDSLKAAPGTGFSHYITDIIIFGGATAGTWQIRDGAGDLIKLYCAINGTVPFSFRVPKKVGSNLPLTVTGPTSVGSGINIHGFTDRG